MLRVLKMSVPSDSHNAVSKLNGCACGEVVKMVVMARKAKNDKMRGAILVEASWGRPEQRSGSYIAGCY